MGTTNNRNLYIAKCGKNDEFYTTMYTVENELKYYSRCFFGRTVYCNCDRPGRSEFWNYFHLNFKRLGLKKLIATYLSTDQPAYKVEYTGRCDYDISEATYTRLNGDGSYNSPECLDILSHCDVVVTNPPFSLFRDFSKYLVISDVDFLIIGPIIGIAYTDIIPFICSNRIKLGSAMGNQSMFFITPEEYRLVMRDQKRIAKSLGDDFTMSHHCATLRTLCWFTTLNYDGEHKQPVFNKQYDPKLYCFFDNYPNVLAVDNVADIPNDYLGPMGVPLTYLFKHNPLHYRVLTQLEKPILHGKTCFRRLVIKKVTEDF